MFHWPLLNGVSVVALRFIGSPPSRRRRFDPPGLSACLSASAASLFVLLVCLGFRIHPHFGRTGRFLSRGTSHRGAAAACDCRGGYLGVLTFDRRWRPEPSWIDRLGRGLGIYWLAAGLVVPILRLFF